jgi:16S rRNA (cytosine967-C5)-methyltransferase
MAAFDFSGSHHFFELFTHGANLRLATSAGKAFIPGVNFDNPRLIAVGVLLDRISKGGFVERHLDRALTRARLSPEDRALCQELTYGSVRWQATLDWLITRLTDGRPQRPVVQVLLRLGLYQIFWLNRIPPHAAVHTTVEAARIYRYESHAGFINAVLRSALRDQALIHRELAGLQDTQPAVGWSHPEWLVTRWTNRYGKEATLKLLEWDNSAAKVYARVNTLKADPAKLLEFWRTDGVSYNFVFKDWLEENLVFELKSPTALEEMRSFKNGFFYVQDPSTLFAVDLLAPKPGERILDLCAAPGGKTTYIAQRMKNEGKIVASDSSPDRLELLKENRDRLGATCVEIVPANALLPADFDRVLVDAPCSNTGVLRRRVDLRWRVTPEEFTRLREEQLALLRRAAAFVKPGGVLVYSTCSLEPEENAGVVEEFLKMNPAFALDEAGDVLPIRDGFDGAYAARLVRKASAL